MNIKRILKKILDINNIQHERVAIYKKNGGERLRLEYKDIDENSVVIDFGGYEGAWASDIFSRYRPTIHIFEPVLSFANNIEGRFKKNNKIFVHKFGLSEETREEKLAVDADSSSSFKTSGHTEIIKLVRAADFFRENNIGIVALMKINIEGGEYELLEHLIESGLINKIKNIQVQFHDFVPNAESMMKNIHEKLKKTHHTTYMFEFVWENWKLNEK